MAKHLVIVESPAKAKTISGYLGSDYDVEASIGHIRDLPLNKKGLPEELRKKWWADYAVDVDDNFKPFYEVPSEKKAQVQKLKKALVGKDTLILATDEDREGESISWHLLQLLKPGKGVQVKRIAFHEITREAIREALNNPRQIDEELVEAQEARRILDRLYGYTLSPVLWSRISKELSAGRVQSPAVKLIVERERERRDFKKASYWDIKADLATNGSTFPARLRTVDGKRVVTGDDFDDTTGGLKAETARACEMGRCLMLEKDRAEALAGESATAKPWEVVRVEQADGIEKPPPPFMTTSLQQEANRKLGFRADRTMRVAQSLYEGVDIQGERVGLITYMRTDSLTLAESAIKATRGAIERLYGKDYVPDKAAHYTNKVRNAQEAHEAIRPTDPNRRPEDVAKFLNKDQLGVYELIWKRTMACQMKPAQVLRTTAEISVVVRSTPQPPSSFSGHEPSPTNKEGGALLTFIATGRQIKFPGFLRVYAEGSDDPEAELEGQERILPALKQGQEVEARSVDADGHETKPPPRYTDATLIKRLEKEGIGRPSTYASIISTIEDRGYVRKEGRQLVPTFKAFLAMDVLENNFKDYMELDFTARMDETLDDIASGKEDARKYLKEFFLGTGHPPGLKTAVEERKKGIPYPAYEVGLHPETKEPILIRLHKDGRPFLQMGTDGEVKYATVPENLPPAEITIEKAVELLAQEEQGPQSIGVDPVTGRRLLLKQKGGYYLEAERTREEIESKQTPRWISVPPGATPADLTQDVLDQLCRLPRSLGSHPDTGADVVLKCGKYGMYVESGTPSPSPDGEGAGGGEVERRTVQDWRHALRMSLEEAVDLLRAPKASAKGERSRPGPLKELGEMEGKQVRVMAGRYGPYVTDGEINATLPKGKDPQAVSLEEAADMIAKKREAGPSPKRKFRRFKKK